MIMKLMMMMMGRSTTLRMTKIMILIRNIWKRRESVGTEVEEKRQEIKMKTEKLLYIIKVHIEMRKERQTVRSSNS